MQLFSSNHRDTKPCAHRAISSMWVGGWLAGWQRKLCASVFSIQNATALDQCYLCYSKLQHSGATGAGTKTNCIRA